MGRRADPMGADQGLAMSFGMTPRQSRCLAFIRTYVSENEGESPSYDEIASGLGLRSKNSVWRMIKALEGRGLIRRLPGYARAIEVVDPDSSLDAGTELMLRTYCSAMGLARKVVIAAALREYLRAHSIQPANGGHQ